MIAIDSVTDRKQEKESVIAECNFDPMLIMHARKCLNGTVATLNRKVALFVYGLKKQDKSEFRVAGRWNLLASDNAWLAVSH